MASPAPSSLFNEKPLLVQNPSGSGSARSRKHNPILPFHKQVIKELASPEEDDLLVMAKGLGMRRASLISAEGYLTRSEADPARRLSTLDHYPPLEIVRRAEEPDHHRERVSFG